MLDIFQFFQPDPGGHINGRVILEKADGLGFVLEEEKVRPCPPLLFRLPCCLCFHLVPLCPPWLLSAPTALLTSPLRHIPSGC